MFYFKTNRSTEAYGPTCSVLRQTKAYVPLWTRIFCFRTKQSSWTHMNKFKLRSPFVLFQSRSKHEGPHPQPPTTTKKHKKNNKANPGPLVLFTATKNPTKFTDPSVLFSNKLDFIGPFVLFKFKTKLWTRLSVLPKNKIKLRSPVVLFQNKLGCGSSPSAPNRSNRAQKKQNKTQNP